MAECSRHPGNPLPGCYWCRYRLDPPVPDALPHEVLPVTKLAAMLADLEGFIERRAAEIAQPLIDEAEQSISAVDQRIPDLQREWGRQREVLERQLAGARQWADELLEDRDRLARKLREVPADGS